jgi:uncharacterized protein YdeI (YjbR/CyaY-like superfamily)
LSLLGRGNAEAREFFARLSYSRQHAYVSWIEQAKKPDTRASRVAQTVALLADKRPQR